MTALPLGRLRLLAVPIAAAALLGAASGSDPAGAATSSRPSVPVHAVTTHTVSVPDTLRPGRVRLNNTGGHSLFVFKQRRFGVPRLVTDLNHAAQEFSLAAVGHDFALLDVIGGRSSVYLDLSRGTYFLTDATLSHYRAADIRSVSVRGPAQSAPAPRSAAVTIGTTNVLRAPKRISRSHFIQLTNRNDALQEVVLFGLGSKTDPAVLADFLAHPSFDKLFKLPLRSFTDLAVLSGHHRLWVHTPLRTGRYLLITFRTTVHTTAPALRADRVRLVTVTS